MRRMQLCGFCQVLLSCYWTLYLNTGTFPRMAIIFSVCDHCALRMNSFLWLFLINWARKTIMSKGKEEGCDFNSVRKHCLGITVAGPRAKAYNLWFNVCVLSMKTLHNDSVGVTEVLLAALWLERSALNRSRVTVHHSPSLGPTKSNLLLSPNPGSFPVSFASNPSDLQCASR